MSAKSSFVWGWSNINWLDCGGRLHCLGLVKYLIRLHWISCTEVSEEIRQTANLVGRVYKASDGQWLHVKNQGPTGTRSPWQTGSRSWWGGSWVETTPGQWAWQSSSESQWGPNPMFDNGL